MPYKVGGFNFPTSTGDYAVTDIPFEPQGVIMFGSNRPETDTLVTGLTGPGLFVSLSALDYLDPGTIRSASLAINGRSDASRANYRGIETGPISMMTDAATAGTVDYRAGSITFGADRFTLNVTKAATGVRPIHYLAWGGDDVFTGAVKQRMTGSPTFENEFNPLSAIVLSTIAANNFGEGSVTGESYFSWGSGHYPAYTGGDPDNWQSSTIYDQIQISSPLGKQGFNNHFVHTGELGSQNLDISQVINVIGPALNEGFRRHRPNAEGGQLSTMLNSGGGASPWQYAVWWNGEGWTAEFTVPAGGQTTISHSTPAFNAFDCVIFSTINGPRFAGGPGGAYQAFGFGVLSDDYQGCVVFGKDGSFYQSSNRCIAQCTASVLDAAHGVINPNGSFTLTSMEGGEIANAVYHGFGPFRELSMWLPQIYRRVFR